MRVLGIDPGTRITGYGVIEEEGDNLKALEWGIIQVTNAPFPLRLKIIYEKLRELLVKFNPEVVAIETLFYAKNAISALKLGHVRGVSLLTAANHGVVIVEYTPLQIKQAVVGYGRASKKQVQDMVAYLLGIDHSLTSTDASDALAIAICHIHSYKLTQAYRTAGLLKISH
jgi:crossover junction endodeoxyribonuclease RuvC